MPLAIDTTALLVPELLTPGKKPARFDLLKVRKVVKTFPYLEIDQVMATPEYIHGSGARFNNIALRQGNNIVVPTSGTTITADKGYTRNGTAPMYVLMRYKTVSYGNYYPSIVCGSAWGGNFTFHGQVGGECYAGASSTARIEPTDTSTTITPTGTWVNLVIGIGVKQDGVSYGVRIAKDGTLLTHKTTGANTAAATQGALTIAGGIEIEYLVFLTDPYSHLDEAIRDSKWMQTMNAIQADPYNELFSLME